MDSLTEMMRLARHVLAVEQAVSAMRQHAVEGGLQSLVAQIWRAHAAGTPARARRTS